MEIGLALPQRADPGGREGVPRWPSHGAGLPGWPVVLSCARRAEELGFASLWLADLPGAAAVDPVVGLGALARATARVRLGTFPLAAPRRPAGVLAKALATVDRLSGGRLVVGVGLEPAATEPSPTGGAPEQSRDAEAEELAETLQVLRGMLGSGGDPFTFLGRHHRLRGVRCLPGPAQKPHPPLWVAGEGEALVDVVAAHGDGWAVAWTATPAAYRRRLAALEEACERRGRDPSAVARAVGQVALVAGDGGDPVGRRGARLEGRPGGLVGTVEQVREQVEAWAGLGVATLVVSSGLPFGPMTAEDVELLAEACSLGAT